MGRRKIEIKAIKDDRNRSVTFLKRKGGLFKKAHELSVLCSVDVAVIIFGHNKKLYEFSSGDINETIGRYQYYGQPHEHKGPADYRGKDGGGDSEEDDEDMSPPHDEMSQPPPQYPPPVQSQHPYPPHLRQQAASASPPIPQHMAFQRHGTPQPANGSRPSSRTDVRRMSSNLAAPQHHATPPPQQQNGFAYIPNQNMYNPQAHPNMTRPPPAQATPPQQYGHFPQPQPPPQQQYQPPPPHFQPQTTQNHQMPPGSQAFIPDQRRQPQGSEAERQHGRPPPQHQQHRTPEPEQRQPQAKVDLETPPRPKAISSKSRSIFTPIEGSVLAQHFGFTEPRQEMKHERHTSDTSSKSGPHAKGNAQSQRSGSMPMPDTIPSRANTSSSKQGGARPRLKVQIPSEASDAEDATAEESSPRPSNATEATPARGSGSSRQSSGVVLPPPSPSASALLSAGATGPPNPFARPPPRDTNALQTNHNAYSGNNNIETPISALPSRFVADNLLPSPSSFYPEWGFGRTAPDSNMLPSPLTFPTPIKESGAGFGRDYRDDPEAAVGEKRKSSLESAATEMKKLKT